MKHTLEEKRNIVRQIKRGRPLLEPVQGPTSRPPYGQELAAEIRKVRRPRPPDTYPKIPLQHPRKRKNNMGTYKKKNTFARTEPPLRCRPQYHKILAEKGPHRRFPLPDKTGEPHGKTQEKRTTDRTGETPGRKPAAQSRECAAKKSEGLSRGKESPGTREWARVIDELRSEYPLDLLLESRQMARSVFYYHKKALTKKEKYTLERDTIKTIYQEHKGRYGYRRVTAEMRNRGFTTNHKTVRRLMDEMELKSRIRKVRYRSYRHQAGKTAPNIIARNFRAEAPNRKWATDVTQINIGPSKLYLSPIIDLFNGEIISYNLSETPNMEQIYDMLDKAFSRNDDLEGLILHSDQGWQYQHYGYRQRLEERNVVQSMSRKGNCLDNAMAESFFAIMKSELLYAENFESPEAFTRALEEYIDYYNHRRIKSRLNGKSPVQYRTLSITG